ncbi:ATP-binding protein [Streptomyces sp. NPDC047024]|uniref:ATP-binding protein n=1 Tax=Streptomyces sp. NPDC047024 TaxID=3155476 RepID=UPI0033FF37E9
MTRERQQHTPGPATEPGGGPRTPAYRPADARSAVRRELTEHCRARAVPCADETLDDALLVVSELTSNAIVHGGGITGFEVAVDSAGVRLSVSDRSDEPPVCAAGFREADRCRTGGRGWPLVCLLARDVRVSGLPCGGKRVTAVVPLR